MKSLKLKSYPGENITDLCTVILVDSELLESSEAFKPENLGHITLIFEDTSDSRFILWVIKKYKEVVDLSINFVCVTWMSYHHSISSPMSPLYKRLHVNTPILSIQIGGSRLPAKKSLNTNLHSQRHTLWSLIIQSTRL